LKKLANVLEPYQGLRKEIYIIALARTINAMGVMIFPFLALILTKKIGMTIAEAGLWVTIGGALFMPSSLIGGKISDSFGRKKVLVIFETIGALGYATAILVEPGMVMIYILLFSSFMFGLAGPSHDAMIGDLTTPEQRQGAYSLGYLGFNLGFAFAQVLGGLLFEEHLKWMFAIDVITALIGISLILFFVKETLGKDEIVIANKKLDMEEKVEGSILSVLKKRPLLIYFALASFGYKFIYSGWSFVMPLHAEANFPGDGASIYGKLGFTNALIVVIMTPILTMLFRKASNLRRIIFAGILFTVGFGLLGFISVQLAFFISVAIFTLGEILEAVSGMPFIMNHTPASHRGRMSSILPIIMGLGYTVGPIVMGKLIDSLSFSITWYIIGGIGTVATGLMIALEIYEKKHRVPPIIIEGEVPEIIVI
jgi:MFS family permease